MAVTLKIESGWGKARITSVKFQSFIPFVIPERPFIRSLQQNLGNAPTLVINRDTLNLNPIYQ